MKFPHPPVLTPDNTNERFEHIKRTIDDIGARQTISEEMNHHLLQVLHDHFDELKVKLNKDTTSTHSSSTKSPSTWSTVVRGKSSKQDSSIKITDNDKSVTFGTKNENEDAKHLQPTNPTIYNDNDNDIKTSNDPDLDMDKDGHLTETNYVKSDTMDDNHIESQVLTGNHKYNKIAS